MTTFNPYTLSTSRNSGYMEPNNSGASERHCVSMEIAQLVPQVPPQYVYYTPGISVVPPYNYSSEYQEQVAQAILAIQKHAEEKAIDVQADLAKQKNHTEELVRRQRDSINISIEKDSLGTTVRRKGSALLYSKHRLSKSDLDIPIFNNCRSTLFRQAEKLEKLILGISFDDAPNLYLAAENWNIKSFKKLLTAAGISIGLCRNRSQSDALQKSINLLIQEAKNCGVVDVPSTYGWYGIGNQFRRVSKARKDLIWKELEAKCIR